MLETFTVETFQVLLNDEFLLRPGVGTAVTLRLTDAVSAGGVAPGGSRAPFSLLFHGPVQPLLPQCIYPLDHPTLGQFDLFLVPVSADGQGITYQAVFG